MWFLSPIVPTWKELRVVLSRCNTSEEKATLLVKDLPPEDSPILLSWMEVRRKMFLSGEYSRFRIALWSLGILDVPQEEEDIFNVAFGTPYPQWRMITIAWRIRWFFILFPLFFLCLLLMVVALSMVSH